MGSERSVPSRVGSRCSEFYTSVQLVKCALACREPVLADQCGIFQQRGSGARLGLLAEVLRVVAEGALVGLSQKPLPQSAHWPRPRSRSVRPTRIAPRRFERVAYRYGLESTCALCHPLATVYEARKGITVHCRLWSDVLQRPGKRV